MVIVNPNNPEMATTPEDTAVSDGAPTGFLDWLFKMPNAGDWMMRMLQQMGYGVTMPGADPLASSTAATAQKTNVIDPFGANFNVNAQQQQPAAGPPKVEDWKPPQAKPPEDTQASF